MVRVFFLLFVVLYTNCRAVKEQTGKEFANVVELAFSLPEKTQIGDTIDVNVILINKSGRRITFFEPYYIGMMEHTTVFRQALIIELLEKQLNKIEKIVEIQKSDSLYYSFKVSIDTNFWAGKIPFQVIFGTVPPNRKAKNEVKFYGNLVSPLDTIEIDSFKKKCY